MRIAGQKWRKSLAGMLLFVSIIAAAQTSEEVFLNAEATFERGVRGSENDNESASAQFRQLSEADAENPLFLAYYGSTITIKARDAWMPWKKLKLGDQCLDLIDKALKRLTAAHDKVVMRKIPVSVETRLVAISTFIQVPDKYFHRYDSGKALLEETMKSAVFMQSPPQIQARFYYQTALVAQQEGKKSDEITQLKRLLDLDPKSIDAGAARARLKALGA